MPLITDRFPLLDRLASLRARLLMLVILALLPPIGLTIHGTIREREHAIAVAESDLQRLTGLAAAGEAKTLEATRQFLVALSGVPDLLRKPAVCSALLRTMLKKNDAYGNLGVLDLNGDVRCSAVESQSRVNVGDRSNVKKTLATGEFATGDHVFGRLDRKHAVNATYPILDDDGNMVAMVFASLDLKALDQFTTNIDFPANAVMITTDGNGNIIARRPDPMKWIGTRAEQNLLEPMLKVGFGTAEITSADGITRLHAFAPIGTSSTSNYMVSIGIPTADIVASANQGQTNRLLALAVTAALALMMAWFVANFTILDRVRALLSAARRIADGDFASRSGIRYGREEISELALAFDHMAQSLQSSAAERDDALARLSAEKERIQVTLQSIGDAVITADREGRVEYMNLIAEVLTGWRADDARGRRLSEVFNVVSVIEDGYRTPATTNGPSHAEGICRDNVLIARDGSEYVIEDSSAPIRDRAHAIVGSVVVFHDVTRSRDLARQIAQQASHDTHGAIPVQQSPARKQKTHA